MTEPQFLALPSARERSWLLRQLRSETVGGLLILVAAAAALVWANSPFGDAYSAMVGFEVGPQALGLHLSLGTWAADGLLAVFFFVVGLELKHELVLGTLSRPSQAAVPILAAIGGMIVPAAFYIVINSASSTGVTSGWGVPMATDIAFALAVLAIAGKRLPIALRAFLLTLAVVDDLGAIAVIAIFYSDAFAIGWFAAAVASFFAYWLAQRMRVTTPLVYLPVVVLGWYFVHESGIHATIAGVVFGLLTRVRTDPGEERAPVDRLVDRIHPISAGLCVPVFAFFAAGVDLRAIGMGDALATPVAIGIILGLVVGKPIGVFVTAWVTARFTRATLSEGIAWKDVAAVGVLGGIGFTVALLISELAYPGNAEAMDSAKFAVLTASVLSAVLATIVLIGRRQR